MEALRWFVTTSPPILSPSSADTEGQSPGWDLASSGNLVFGHGITGVLCFLLGLLICRRGTERVKKHLIKELETVKKGSETQAAQLMERVSEVLQIRATHSAELKILREEHNRHIESLKSSSLQEKEGLLAEMERQRSEHVHALDSLRDYYESLLEKKREEFQVGLLELQKTTDEELY